MDDGGGVVCVCMWGGGVATMAAWAYICDHSAMHRKGREAESLYQHATAGPGCISHAWPLSLSSLPL